MLWVELNKTDTHSDSNIIMGTIYRRPGSDIPTFNDKLMDILTIIKNEKKECQHCGDYNLDILKSDTHNQTNDFILTNFSNSFIPQICKPTRVTNSSATLIDNIFSNIIHNSPTTNGIIISDISDHFPIFYIKYFNNSTSQSNPEYKLKRQINEINRAKFTQEIIGSDWTEIMTETDAQESYTKFHNHLTKVFEKCFPIKKVKIGYLTKLPWLTPGMKKSIKIKQKLYALYLRHSTSNNRDIYKNYKNHLNKLITSMERKYFQDQLQNSQNNLRKSWMVIKSIINKKNIYS
jgi:hypothetical protein